MKPLVLKNKNKIYKSRVNVKFDDSDSNDEGDEDGNETKTT